MPTDIAEIERRLWSAADQLRAAGPTAKPEGRRRRIERRGHARRPAYNNEQ